MKKILSFFLAVCLAVPLFLTAAPEADAYEMGEAFRKDLSAWIHDAKRREYVEMMLDHYIRTNTMVKQALEGGFCAMFLFDGCSDNMNDPDLQDLTYYRVTGVCAVIRLNSKRELQLVYFNDNVSTIPDKPLKIGAWWLAEAGDVGPATICDGTYQIYSVQHKGQYEALHIRTEYYDALVNAVYMTEDGYVSSRASEINIHTRTSNHISGSNSMWSAGCPLIGGGNAWEFWRLIQNTYYSVYESYEAGNFVGTVTIDRSYMKEELYELYENRDAVDMFLTNSRNAQPEQYLKTCSDQETYPRAETKIVTMGTQMMTLPCSNATDARSRLIDAIAEGEEIRILGSIRNTAGNLWYQVELEDRIGYVYSGHVEKDSLADWIFDTLFT